MGRSDPTVRAFRNLLNNLLYDSERSVLLPAQDPPLNPQEWTNLVPDEDLYLAQAYVASDADILVTTDRELQSSLGQFPGFNCRLRGDFLQSYMAT